MIENQEHYQVSLVPGAQPPLAPVRDGRVTSQNARIANATAASAANIDGLRKL